MKETKLRSLTKALSWRITATLLTVVIVYVYSQDASVVLLGIGITEFIVKIAWYFVHERLWLLTKWQRR